MIGIAARAVTVGVFVALLAGAEVQAQSGLPLPPPIDGRPLRYSSPYGPRQMSGTDNEHPPQLFYFYQFHKGIDYAFPLSTPVYAVEPGTITAIDYQEGAAGFYMKVRSARREFAYMHLFDDSLAHVGNPDFPTDGDGNLVIGTGFADVVPGSKTPVRVTLETQGPASLYDWSDCRAIVFWLDYVDNVPWYALSPCPGIQIGHPPVVTKSCIRANAADTDDCVSTERAIASVGQSGAAEGAPHLHVQVKAGEENPLLYIDHDHSEVPDYGISIFKDKGVSSLALDDNAVLLGGNRSGPVAPASVLDATTDFPLVLRAEINYHDAGHDLDRVNLLMYPEGSPQPSLDPLDANGELCLLDGRCRTFNYGGTGTGLNISTLHCKATEPCAGAVIQGGVYPQSGKGGGVVDFLSDPIDVSSLAPGRYIIDVEAFNVLGQGQSFAVTVELDSKLTVTATCEGPTSLLPENILDYVDRITIREHLSGSVAKNEMLPAPTLVGPVPGYADSALAILNSEIPWFVAATPPYTLCVAPVLSSCLLSAELFCPYDALTNHPGSPCMTEGSVGLDWSYSVNVFTPIDPTTGAGRPPNPALPLGPVTINVPAPIISGTQGPPLRVIVSCPP